MGIEPSLLEMQRVAFALVAVAACLGTPLPAHGEGYDTAIERSRALERDHRYAEGADLLARARLDYPQDFTIALRLGWLSFLARRYDDAERGYREAVALSGGQSADARSGLGWSLLRLGKRAEAAREFRAALELAPGDAIATGGLAAATSSELAEVEWFPVFAPIGHYYATHPYKSFAGTANVGVSVLLGRHLLLGATYRGSLFAYDPSAEPPRQATTSFAQHEGYLSLGWVAPRAGLVAHYGLVRDGSGFSGTSHHLGGTFRVSPWGDVVLGGAYSRYDDLEVGRVELSWRIPLGESCWVRPAGAAQRTSDDTLGTGYATLGYDGPGFGAWLGGKYGAEVRPAYLGVPLVMNLPERVVYGGGAGVRGTLGGRWVSTLSVEVHVLERTDGLLPERTPAVFTTLALARAL